MAELKSKLHSAGPAMDTIAKVTEEFRIFRELMFTMLSVIRKQINECSRMIDVTETRRRRKALLFLGVPEAGKKDCKCTILSVIHKMELTNILANYIGVCHGIGAPGKNLQPSLVRFVKLESRISVRIAKAKLKGSSVSVKEFLTKARQAVYKKAWLHSGFRTCWTQDGIIVVKATDRTRHKIVTMYKLNYLILKYPKASNVKYSENKTQAQDTSSKLGTKSRQ